MSVESTLRRFNSAKSNKDHWRDLLQDCWDYALPMRRGFYSEVNGQERMDKIFDETAVDALQEFAGIVINGLFSGNWFEIEPGTAIVDEDEREKIEAQLSPVNKYIHRCISASNFDQIIQEPVEEMAVSLGNILVEEGEFGIALNFKGVSTTRLYVDVGADGQIDGVFYVRNINYEHLDDEYPDGAFSSDTKDKMKGMKLAGNSKTCQILEASYRDRSRKDTLVYKHDVIEIKKKKLVQSKERTGTGARRWVNFRWSASCDEAYGRGPCITAMPTIRNLNLVEELGLEAAQLRIGGVFQADDDGEINFDNIVIEPLSVIPRETGSRGLEPLNFPGDPNFEQFVLEKMQQSVRRIFLNEEFGSLNRTPRPVEEQAGRQASLTKKIRSNILRQIVELVIPLGENIIGVLTDAGKIEIPKIDGKQLMIRPKGPFIKMLEQLESQDIMNYISIAGQVVGDPGKLPMIVNIDNALKHIRKGYSIPEDVNVTPEQRKTAIENLGGALNENSNEGNIPPEGGGPLPPA